MDICDWKYFIIFKDFKVKSYIILFFDLDIEIYNYF